MTELDDEGDEDAAKVQAGDAKRLLCTRRLLLRVTMVCVVLLQSGNYNMRDAGGGVHDSDRDQPMRQ